MVKPGGGRLRAPRGVRGLDLPGFSFLLLAGHVLCWLSETSGWQPGTVKAVKSVTHRLAHMSDPPSSVYYTRLVPRRASTQSCSVDYPSSIRFLQLYGHLCRDSNIIHKAVPGRMSCSRSSLMRAFLPRSPEDRPIVRVRRIRPPFMIQVTP
ncbi:hypothetical protein F5X68DRAFT_81197 [Plectosphaerella plurivora]|uniref:Uncharacterized protein n=1 Tax=Plectosphaerella plurivora TaxID=936078 RepID=A0A9P8VFI4_9PEZI|nr:hypothetical protein F5X68DRAFT_81197 [Plectosphaerella plurivora]